jgi:hypothetical protein
MNDLKFTTAGDYMNTAMEDLMYRAGLTASGCWDNMDDYDRKAIEKFAELIVQECIGIADEYDGVGSTIVSRIKKHFGVEDRAVPILSADEQALFAVIASSKLFTIAGAKKQFGVEE